MLELIFFQTEALMIIEQVRVVRMETPVVVSCRGKDGHLYSRVTIFLLLSSTCNDVNENPPIVLGCIGFILPAVEGKIHQIARNNNKIEFPAVSHIIGYTNKLP
ncbi:hypothetical protein ES703_72802 [subsurface metagenome]